MDANRIGIEASEDAVKKTTKCRKNFSCLSDREICKVELCIDNKIHFIKCVDKITHAAIKSHSGTLMCVSVL